jgi:hypothetical protein
VNKLLVRKSTRNGPLATAPVAGQAVVKAAALGFHPER